MSVEDKFEVEPTGEEIALYSDISRFVEGLWKKTLGITGFSSDPRMLSCVLFKRLRSNHRGYTLLWNDRFRLESDIILRSALEAAICLSALVKLKDEFVLLMRQDAASTIQGLIKVYRDNGSQDLVPGYEQEFRRLQGGFPEGVKAAKLEWKKLAISGNVPQLYDWHKDLSGVSSHVTGLSILDGFGGEVLDEKQKELRSLNRRLHLMMMAGATLWGSMRHAEMIGDEVGLNDAQTLIERMNAWSGI